MKKRYLYIILFASALVAFLIIFGPVKRAVKQEDLNKAKNYILVNIQKATISPWTIVGRSPESDNRLKNVRLTGNFPSGYSYAIEFGENTFVCYGNFEEMGQLAEEKYEIFQVEKWDILYPIKRDSVFQSVLPKSYLCIFDKQ